MIFLQKKCLLLLCKLFFLFDFFFLSVLLSLSLSFPFFPFIWFGYLPEALRKIRTLFAGALSLLCSPEWSYTVLYLVFHYTVRYCTVLQGPSKDYTAVLLYHPLWFCTVWLYNVLDGLFWLCMVHKRFQYCQAQLQLQLHLQPSWKLRWRYSLFFHTTHPTTHPLLKR